MCSVELQTDQHTLKEQVVLVTQSNAHMKMITTVSQVCINQELPDIVLDSMMIDFNFLEKVKQKVFAQILSEMNSKEKQKSLSKHIIWTEPKYNVFYMLTNKIK